LITPELAVTVGEGADQAREDLERKILKGSEEGACEYLLRGWFYHAMEAARDARIRNGLKQAEIADKLGTTQSAVARLENAHRGNFSLDRFLRYAWACGAAPLDLEFVPPAQLCQYSLRDPSAPRTARAFRWRQVFEDVEEQSDWFLRLGSTWLDPVDPPSFTTAAERPHWSLQNQLVISFNSPPHMPFSGSHEAGEFGTMSGAPSYKPMIRDTSIVSTDANRCSDELRKKQVAA
jgi:transcriptional regulator with XRE-family HTH domain